MDGKRIVEIVSRDDETLPKGWTLPLPEGWERVTLAAMVNPQTDEYRIPALRLSITPAVVAETEPEAIVPLPIFSTEGIPRREPVCTPSRLDIIPIIGPTARRVGRVVRQRTFVWDTPAPRQPPMPAPVAPARTVAPRRQTGILDNAVRKARMLPWLLALAVFMAAVLAFFLLIGFDPQVGRMLAAPSEPATGPGGPTAARWTYDTCPNTMATRLAYAEGTDIIGNLDGQVREVSSAEKAGTVSRDLHALCAAGPEGGWVPVILEGEHVFMRESSLSAFPWNNALPPSSEDSEDY